MPPTKRVDDSSFRHFPHYDKLPTPAEVEIATKLIGLEKEIASSFASSSNALRALGDLADDINHGRVRLRDALRNGENGSESRRLRRRVIESLTSLAESADSELTPTELERRRHALAALGFHRRILDRIARAIEKTHPVADVVRGLQNAADRCKNELVRANLGVAVAVARRCRRRDVELADLIQEGTIGMLRACDKFDPARGHRFSTYAAFWARQQILRAVVDHIPEIRVPLDVAAARHKVRKAQVALTRKHGRAPSPDEVAAASGLAPSIIATVTDLSPPPVSLHAPIGTDGRQILDLIADASVAASDLAVENAQQAAMLRTCMDRLSPRDASILGLRFGFHEDEPLTLREVGARLKISAERVRRIEERALKRLAKLTCPVLVNDARVSVAA